MTISSTTRVAGPYTGTGSVSTFSFAFKVFATTDVAVTTTNQATGAVTTLTLTTDYSVSLNSDQDGSPGGSITLQAGSTAAGAAGGVLATGYTLSITSAVPQLQGVELSNGGAFYPDVINDALDRLTILVQQLQVSMAAILNNTRVKPCTLTTAYTVYTAPGNVAVVFVNGLAQPSTAYTAVGPVITFATPLKAGVTVYALCTS